MSFEILRSTGGCGVWIPVTPAPVSTVHPSSNFCDADGRWYQATFDGDCVVFRDATEEYDSRWIQGTAAVTMASGRGLPGGFIFTFMDHGKSPQRLHALWRFDGSLQETVECWLRAGFYRYRMDWHFNRRHPDASIHLRTRGNWLTGGNSAHVIISGAQTGNHTVGNIHVGEFNPFTGFGIGFILHQMEALR